MSTAGKLPVMQSLLNDLSANPVGLRHPVPRGIPTHPPTNLTDAEIGFGIAPNSRGFVEMLKTYHASGGLTRGDTLGRLLDDWRCGDFISLARLIASNEIFSFKWHSKSWVPMFQFELRNLSVKPGPSRVLAELKPALDDWGTAAWFIQPNSWLQAKRPLDLVDSDLADVLEAARADLRIAAGKPRMA